MFFFNLDLTNVLILKFEVSDIDPIKFFLFSKWTNLGPTSVDLIFYAPNVANLGFWKIVPTIEL